jgi:hypothetical protein
MSPIGLSLARQLRGAFDGLRDVIRKMPDTQWCAGSTRDQVPARRAQHAIMCLACHAWGARWEPVRRDESGEPVYRSRADMLAYLDDTERNAQAALGGVADAEFLQVSTRAESRLERWVYAVRHLQHHVGQLSATLRERRLTPMKWY